MAVVRPCDSAIWLGLIFRPCVQSMQVSYMVRPYDENIWFGPEVRPCGLAMQLGHVVQPCGKAMWFSHVVWYISFWESLTDIEWAKQSITAGL